MEIPGIPASIPLTKVQEMIRTLGLDPAEVHSLFLDNDGFRVEVFALDNDGHRYVQPGSEDTAVHTVQIKLEG